MQLKVAKNKKEIVNRCHLESYSTILKLSINEEKYDIGFDQNI